MCGFIGSIGIKGDFNLNSSWVSQSLDSISYRGPDNKQIWKSEEEAIILGHVRLSIQDLNDSSNQPFSLNKNYQLIY